MYAIIKAGGKQFRVSPGDVIRVETLEGDKGTAVEFPVIGISNDQEPLQAGKKVAGKVSGVIVNHGRGAKVIVFKFKEKKQYKRTAGHRQNFTTVKIEKIEVA
jgi:large subunit ribosomal protein L21